MIKRGRVSPANKADVSRQHESFLTQMLQKVANFEGFAEEDKNAIAGWLRATSVLFIPDGRSKRGEVIDYIRPLTAASYRSGFPVQRSRHRGTHEYLFTSLYSAYRDAGNDDSDGLREILNQTALTHGVNFSEAAYPYRDPKYDGTSKIDISSLLSLRYLEGIPSREISQNQKSLVDGGEHWTYGSPLPAIHGSIGTQLYQVLSQFRHWSSPELVSIITCLSSIHLYQLPLRTHQALLEIGFGVNKKWPEGYPVTIGESNQSEMFCDFTGDRDGLSYQLAKKCVARDFSKLTNFFPQLVLARETERALRQDPKLNTLLNTMKPHEILDYILSKVDEEDTSRLASYALMAITTAIPDSDTADGQRTYIEETRSRFNNDLRALCHLVLEDRSRVALDSVRKWLYSTGGLQPNGQTRDGALLRGTMRSPQTWAYSLSDDMLLAVVSMCFFDERGVYSAREITMQVLLERLESKFGILVSRPPKGFESEESYAASRQNYSAFTQKLKTLGCFRGLSDDFEAVLVSFPGKASL
jgi:hypothetical protein